MSAPECNACNEAKPSKRDIGRESEQLRGIIEKYGFKGDKCHTRYPHNSDHAPAPDTGEKVAVHRSKRARDQNEYGRVIQALKHQPRGTAVGQKMIHTTHGQQEHAREPEHRQRNDTPHTLALAIQKIKPQAQKHPGRNQMRPATHWFGKSGNGVDIVHNSE